jgi:PhnB protein
MTVNVNPYLTFDGNCREAMEFYRTVLGGELTVNTFGEFGGPAEVADKVMHAMLLGGLGTLMASDTAPGMPFAPGNTMTISVSGAEGDGLEDVWSKVSAGGEVFVPFEKQMWGDVFGQCADKYGVPWMVNVTQGA